VDDLITAGIVVQHGVGETGHLLLESLDLEAVEYQQTSLEPLSASCSTMKKSTHHLPPSDWAPTMDHRRSPNTKLCMVSTLKKDRVFKVREQLN
jgi:hypothetical protein